MAFLLPCFHKPPRARRQSSRNLPGPLLPNSIVSEEGDTGCPRQETPANLLAKAVVLGRGLHQGCRSFLPGLPPSCSWKCVLSISLLPAFSLRRSGAPSETRWGISYAGASSRLLTLSAPPSRSSRIAGYPSRRTAPSRYISLSTGFKGLRLTQPLPPCRRCAAGIP